MKKRDLSSEIAEGFEALAEAREGKRTLRTHTTSIYRRNDVLFDAEDLILIQNVWHGFPAPGMGPCC